MRKLLVGAGLAIAALLGWKAISRSAGRPLTDLDEQYSTSPPLDPYLWDLVSGTSGWW